MKLTSRERLTINRLLDLFNHSTVCQKFIALSNSKNESKAELGKRMLYRFCRKCEGFTPKLLTIAIMIYNRNSKKPIEKGQF